MRPTTILFAAAVAASAFALPAAAQTAPAERFAVGVQGGTTGLGVEGQFAASDRLTLRGTVDVFQYDGDFSSDDVDYEGELDLNQGGLFVDYHPTGGGLFVSGGAYFGERKADIRATANTSVEIGNTVFTAAQVGTLQGEADLGEVAPFVGVGYNNTFTTAGRLGFKVLVGAAFNGDPDVTLSRVGGVALTPAVQAQLDAELRNEEAEIEDAADDLSIFPVLQIGLAYRF
jgi:hypothetical protein